MLPAMTFTLVVGSCAQRTGISETRNPCHYARIGLPGQTEALVRCCSKRVHARSRRKALEPHWVCTQ
jgi:hypothetical protein